MAVRKLRVLTAKEAGACETTYKPQGLVPIITGPDADGDTWACGKCGHVIMQQVGPNTPPFPDSAAECAVCHAMNDIDLRTLH